MISSDLYKLAERRRRRAQLMSKERLLYMCVVQRSGVQRRLKQYANDATATLSVEFMNEILGSKQTSQSADQTSRVWFEVLYREAKAIEPHNIQILSNVYRVGRDCLYIKSNRITMLVVFGVSQLNLYSIVNKRWSRTLARLWLCDPSQRNRPKKKSS